jgi:ferredoxin-type protein NapH
MKSKRLRVVTALAVIVLITIGFLTNLGIGTVSAIGWADISILCPLGALGTMLASKLLVPRALIALVIAVVLIILLGRAFCAWACPVPILQRIRGIFSTKNATNKREDLSAPAQTVQGASVAPAQEDSAHAQDAPAETKAAKASVAPLTAKEQSSLSTSGSDCGSCTKKRGAVDSRHFILGGSLLSAAIFGFPVFCLICPIGLTFATILLVIRLFGGGDITWSLIIVPLLLVVEVVVFRKWCSKLCPLSAFMSLLGKLNRTFKPTINDKTCIETAEGRPCGICGKVCPEGIDPRHPEFSTVAWSECTKCRECVEACPTKALRMPLLPAAISAEPKDPDSGKEQEQAA